MATDGKPLLKGVREYRTFGSTQRAPKTKMNFSSNVPGLAWLADKFTFFTIAPAYLVGRLSESVLCDFLSLHGAAVFFFAKFRRPVFSKLVTPDGNEDWNYVLWAVKTEFWAVFEQHMRTSIMVDSRSKALFSFDVQELTILDPLYVDLNPVCSDRVPALEIRAIGVKSNLYTAAFDLEQPVGLVPVFKAYPPDDVCLKYAKVIFEQGFSSLAYMLE